MPSRSWIADWQTRHPSIPYVAPFAVFLLLLVLSERLPAGAAWDSLLRLIVVGGICIVCRPRDLPLTIRVPLQTVALGLAAFVIWIGPDALIPGYRNSWPFSNPIAGHVHSSLSVQALRSPIVLSLRSARAISVVPVAEELFWRGWLMRWLIDGNFGAVPLGTYTPFSFWLVAVLFASEHGPYWDVGLLTGILYNAWMVHTKSIGDCILAHATTNAALCIYVMATKQWGYWL